MPQIDLARLAKLCGMFGSAHHGERANAAAMADELVRQSGMTWHEVLCGAVASVMPWRDAAEFCLSNEHALSEKEAGFLRSILHQDKDLSDRQAAWLESIFKRVSS